MKRWLRIALGIPAGLVLSGLTVFVALFLATLGDHGVPATVVDDASLPAIQVDGLRLHAEAFGPADAPVVVVLHGGPGNDYRALLPLQPLSDQYRVVFYDQRGAGLSERVPATRLTVEDYVAELHGVIEAYSPAPVHLIGHSWGAMLATAYLAEHPNNVTSAILVEPGFLTPEASIPFLEVVGSPPITLAFASHLVWTGFESLHVSGPDDDALGDYFMARLVMGAPTEGHPMGRYFCDADPANAALESWRFGSAASAAVGSYVTDDGTVDIDLTTGLDAFEGPVMLVAGSCNTLIGPEHQARYHAPLFRNARLEVIEDAGHSLIGEQPQVVVPLFRTFLNETRPRNSEAEGPPPVTP